MSPADALFPEIEPFETGRLAVSGGHEIAWEQSGRRDAPALLFLHGGPGSGKAPKHRRYADPDLWRTVQFDQRGCGESSPALSIENNTTADLIGDIEALRSRLGVERWTVFGPSWGSTLTLAYAAVHPERVDGVLVEGVFLGSREEIGWVWSEAGAGAIFPESLERLLDGAPESLRRDMRTQPWRFADWGLDALKTEIDAGAPALDALDDPDAPIDVLRESLAYRWSEHEMLISYMEIEPDAVRGLFAENGKRWVLAHSLIEAHYFANACFLEPGELLQAARGFDMPVSIVQSRYDIVCPLRAAWRLAQAAPSAEFSIAPRHGHAMGPPVHALVRRALEGLRAARLG